MPPPISERMTGPLEFPFGGNGGTGDSQPIPRTLDAASAFLPQTESAEGLTFLGQDFLVTGGGQGTGKQAAFDIVSQGGRVALGTRNPAKVESFRVEIMQAQEDGEISEQIDLSESVRPFTVDLNSQLDIIEGVYDLRESGFDQLDGWIHAAAEGMQTFTTRNKLLGGIVTLRGIKKRQGQESDIYQEARRDLQRNLAQWVWQAMPGAMNSNYEGPRVLLNEIRDRKMLKPGAKITNFGSVWTDQVGQPEVEVPSWYLPVCTKQSFDLELQAAENRTKLEAEGIFPFTLIGQVIDNTGVGDMFRGGIFQLMSDEDATKYAESNKPMTTADMSRALQMMLLSDPNNPAQWTPGKPRKLYVLGPTDKRESVAQNILWELPQGHPMLTFRSPI